MIKNKILQRLALLVSVIMLLTSTVNTTYGFIETKTDRVINTFIPFDSVMNNLQISKRIEHYFGNSYAVPEDIAFDFKIDFGLGYAKNKIKTTSGEFVADENGSILVSIKPGEDFAVEGIATGTKVTVTEIQKEGSGFAVKNGAATMQGVISEEGILDFQYVNIYTPASVKPVNVTVKGEKILEGREWQEGDTFSFVLEQKKSDDTWTLLGKKTVSYSEDNENFNLFDFSDLVQGLTFDKVGVYNFRITEVLGDLEDIDYDKSINTFSIHVTDVDMDGKLEINTVKAAQNAKVSEKDGKYNVSVTFNNTYAADIPEPEELTVKIDVVKKIKNTGDSSIEPSGFEFVLENTVSGEKYALKSDETGNAVFELTFNAADIGNVYTYKLSETNDGVTGVIYDTKVYDISVSIILNDDNQLIANIAMNGSNVENPVVEFINTYHMETADAPQSGDKHNLTGWLIMMHISGMACVFIILTEKKYYVKDKH